MGCFRAFGIPAYTMNASSPVVVVPERRSRPSTGSNTVLGNVKNAIIDSYHAIRDQYVPRYLAEFEYRFNRRYDLKAMIPRLLTVAARTPPLPYRLLKLAEPHM